jgi:hypothetical protein
MLYPLITCWAFITGIIPTIDTTDTTMAIAITVTISTKLKPLACLWRYRSLVSWLLISIWR